MFCEILFIWVTTVLAKYTIAIMVISLVTYSPTQVSAGAPCPVGQSHAGEIVLLETWPKHPAGGATALGSVSQPLQMGPLAF